MVNEVTESSSIVEASILGKVGLICIDTGAHRSCIALDRVNKMHRVKWVSDYNKPELVSASGDSLNIIGKVELPIEIRGASFI